MFRFMLGYVFCPLVRKERIRQAALSEILPVLALFVFEKKSS